MRLSLVKRVTTTYFSTLTRPSQMGATIIFSLTGLSRLSFSPPWACSSSMTHLTRNAAQRGSGCCHTTRLLLFLRIYCLMTALHRRSGGMGAILCQAPAISNAKMSHHWAANLGSVIGLTPLLRCSFMRNKTAALLPRPRRQLVRSRRRQDLPLLVSRRPQAPALHLQ